MDTNALLDLIAESYIQGWHDASKTLAEALPNMDEFRAQLMQKLKERAENV